MHAIRPLLERYGHGITLIEALAHGASTNQLHEHPLPGTWSLLENLCHLADFEPVFAERMKRTIALDNPTVMGADENRFSQRLGYERRDAFVELDIIRLTRRQMQSILNGLERSDFERICTHSESGTITLVDLIEKACRHLEHHGRHMNEKRKALGLPPVSSL